MSGLDRLGPRPDRVIECPEYGFPWTSDQRDRDDFFFKIFINTDFAGPDFEVSVLTLYYQRTEMFVVRGDPQ